MESGNRFGRISINVYVNTMETVINHSLELKFSGKTNITVSTLSIQIFETKGDFQG